MDDSTNINGNCYDPKCFPYCAACGNQSQSLGAAVIVMLVVMICLLAILLVFWLIYGPTLLRVN